MVLEGAFPPDARVRKETAALLDAGHDVRVLTERAERETDPSTVADHEPERETVDGVDVVRFPPVNGSTRERLARSYRAVVHGTYPRWDRRIRREVEDGVDVVHVHDLRLARTALSAAGDRPTVLDLHENFPEAVMQYRRRDTLTETLTSTTKIARRVFRPKRHWDRRLRSALESADETLAVVPEARREYLAADVDPGSVTVVSNTVDTEWFDANREAYPKPDSEGFVLTYAGTLSGDHRGVDTAIRSLVILKDLVPDATLRIVGGRSKMMGRLQDFCVDLGVESDVEFTGWVDEAAFPSQLSAADVGLVPHRANPHTNTTVPHKLFQYMAAELPVVATETTAVARCVRDVDAGIVVPSEDPAAMAKAAAQLADPAIADRLGGNARRAAESTYNWERDAERLRAVYANLKAEVAG